MLDNLIPNITKVLEHYWRLFLQGVGFTLLLSAVTVSMGAVFGTVTAMMRRARFQLVRGIASAYVEIIRGTPLLLQLYFFYFLLPDLVPVLNLSKFACICVALVVNSAAYVSEIVRAGIQAVDSGQTEAARTLGLSGSQAMARIVFPQAVKNILPALCNEFVTVIKETSLASTFFVGDLMTQYKTISGNMFLVIEPLIVVGVIYFALTFSLSKGIAVLERRLKQSD
jgi:arginine/lysine/histidine transport system permease protein